MVAAAIDLAVVIGIQTVLLAVAGKSESWSGGHVSDAELRYRALAAIVVWIYLPTSLALTRGRTLGRRIMHVPS